MKLHFPSALLALGLVGLAAFLSSQASPPPALLNPASIRVEYVPHPRDYVQIKGVTPYTVPPGKVFVLTAIGNTVGVAGGCAVSLFVDESLEMTVNASGSVAMTPVPSGLTVAAGSTVTLGTGTGCEITHPLLRAWGYLASQ